MITESLASVVEALESEEYVVTEPVPGTLLVTGRFSNPERIALQAAALAGDQRIAVWARSHRDDWALVCWDRPQLVTITCRELSPLRWRHRVLPPTLQPNAQTFLEGASSSYDIVTRPKHQPTAAAREILASFDITEPAPPGWVAPTPVVEAVRVVRTTVPVAGAKKVAAPRAPRATTAREPKAQPQSTVKICQTCFMAIPATGICDNCG
ncbi:hypothetical protein [Nocardioides montaniterrae]